MQWTRCGYRRAGCRYDMQSLPTGGNFSAKTNKCVTPLTDMDSYLGEVPRNEGYGGR